MLSGAWKANMRNLLLTGNVLWYLSIADDLPLEQQQETAGAQLRWLQQQPLLARLLTSQQQEDSIRASTQQQQCLTAAAAADDAPNGAKVDMEAAKGDGQDPAAAAADLVMLKQDMLRVEALMADALVRLTK
jgi:hypothetical protein